VEVPRSRAYQLRELRPRMRARPQAKAYLDRQGLKRSRTRTKRIARSISAQAKESRRWLRTPFRFYPTPKRAPRRPFKKRNEQRRASS